MAKRSQVLIVGAYLGFPRGLASTTHVRLMAKGLACAGRSVRLLITSCSEDPGHPLNRQARGEVDGLLFEYTAGTTCRSRYALGRLWFRIRALVVASLRMIKERKASDAVILYGESYIHLLWLRYLCSILNLKLVVWVVEWPMEEERGTPDWVSRNGIAHYAPIVSQSGLGHWDSLRFYGRAFALADGVIVTSRFLEKKCREKGDLPSLRIPVLVDPGEWKGIDIKTLGRPFFLFCAYLDGYVHDALFLVEGLRRLGRRDYDLVMIGKASAETRAIIDQTACSAGLSSQLRLLTDYVSDRTLRQFYSGATALLAPLHRDARSMARFPSKIGHYLMSGRPVVTLSAGDVVEYLTDGVSAFLYDSDEPGALASKLAEILYLDDRGGTVGATGRGIAQTAFDYRMQGRGIARFVEGLNNE